MNILLLPFVFLPLFEIAGFVLIGGEIGLGGTFLWLIGSTWLGFYLLQVRAPGAWARTRSAGGEQMFVVADLFDSLSIVIAAVLLIFPGFISDFLAVPFLLAPCRHWMFRRVQANPDNFVRRRARSAQEAPTTIDGTYRDISGDARTPPGSTRDLPPD